MRPQESKAEFLVEVWVRTSALEIKDIVVVSSGEAEGDGMDEKENLFEIFLAKCQTSWEKLELARFRYSF